MHLTQDIPETGPGNQHIVLTHGASQPMSSRFFETLVPALLEHGLTVWRFEFDIWWGYAKPGNAGHHLASIHCSPKFCDAVAHVRGELPEGATLIAGGKSWVGALQAWLGDTLHNAGAVAGIVCLGYPFHPPKRPESLRTAHLEALKVPTLILQGERDPFGTVEDVAGYDLSTSIDVVWIGDGDHDFGPRGRSASLARVTSRGAAAAVAEFPPD